MTKVHTGFSGTRMGMTRDQLNTLRTIMNTLTTIWHHGDCIGADAQSHTIAIAIGMPIEIHPAINDTRRAKCTGATIIHRTRGYIDRNHDIVEATQHLIAAPKDQREMVRSGTWATIRYARTLRRPITIIFPNGAIQKERS